VDWISTHLRDTALRSEVRKLDADHVLSRPDVLTIFSSVAVGGVSPNHGPFVDRRGRADGSS
jgi:hypothetical protein